MVAATRTAVSISADGNATLRYVIWPVAYEMVHSLLMPTNPSKKHGPRGICNGTQLQPTNGIGSGSMSTTPRAEASLGNRWKRKGAGGDKLSPDAPLHIILRKFNGVAGEKRRFPLCLWLWH